MAYPNFNYGLAFRSQGVTPDMYSDDPEEAQKMMYEDADARWKQDKAGFQRDMNRQGALERKQSGGQPQSRPRATAPAAAGGNAMGNWQHPIAAQHFGAQNDMFAATNAAWAGEMANRRKLAENERERQHQYQIEAMRQQGANQRAQAEPQGDSGGGFKPDNAARQARNRSLLNMAGLGGHRIQNGKYTPHPYQSPLARSMLG